MTETAMIAVERFRDSAGRPTCAANFETGAVCRFYATQRFGCHETCMFAGDKASGKYWPPLERRDNGNGVLIPMAGCPVWPEIEAAELEAIEATNSPVAKLLAEKDAQIATQKQSLLNAQGYIKELEKSLVTAWDYGNAQVPATPFAVFDEFGMGADDRVQDYAARLLAAERERCASLCESRSANGNYEHDTRHECAAAIRGAA